MYFFPIDQNLRPKLLNLNFTFDLNFVLIKRPFLAKIKNSFTYFSYFPNESILNFSFSAIEVKDNLNYSIPKKL